MSVVQSTYSSRQTALALGQVVNDELHNIITRIQADSTAVPFGRAMFKGSTDDTVTATPSANFAGFTVRKPTLEGGTADTYPQRENVPLLNMGVICVTAAVAVNQYEQVYVTSGGLITNVSTSNTAITGAKFDGTIAAAGLVAVRVK